MRTSTRVTVGALLAALLFTGCWPVPPADDAGAASFYEQFVPLLLGRRLRNAHEREYLLDLEALYGRQVVMDLLMGEPEFVDHWRGNLLRGMELQRDGNRRQREECFGEPMRFPNGEDGGELAAFIRDNPLTSGFPGTSAVGDLGGEAVADDPYNMADVIQSALVLDDLSVIYKAYIPPMVIADGDLQIEDIGKAFNRTVLNRNLDCTECHNIQNQAFIRPIEIDLEPQVFGCVTCSGPGIDQSEIWSVFRQDITGDDAPSGQTMVRPWGLHPLCGMLAAEFTGGSQPTVFAGLSGGYAGAPHLVDQFSAGVDSIRANGLSFSGGAYLAEELPPDQSLVYMVSAKIVENVWEDLLGFPFTEAHHYAKNEDQRDMHRYLTERLIISDWSLRELISLVMATGYPNRRSPAQSVQDFPDVLAPIFDAFAGETNGQGDLVFRYPPHALFSHARGSLGWPEWNPYPGEEYPSLDLNRDLEQYLSDSSAGAKEWSFQSLIAWESTVAACENPGGGTDWVDRLIEAAEAFDADHPEDPLTVRDVVRTVKDRLIGDTRISNGPDVEIDDLQNENDHGICCGPGPIDDYENPGGGDDDDDDDFAPLPPIEAETELEALEAMFGTGLHNPASSVGELEERVRRLCGTLLRSPQRVLAGIVDRDAPASSPVPRLVVGNSGEPATYQQICQSYRPGLSELGVYVTCALGGVSQTPGVTVRPNPHDASRRETDTKLIQSFVASLDLEEGIYSRRSSLFDPRSGEPIPDEDLDTLLAWARGSSPDEILAQVPRAVLYGAPPDAGSYDRMLKEARRVVNGCDKDTDGDGICDEADPCLFYPNRIPLVDRNHDGLPDECACGDADGSGLLDAKDVAVVSQCAATDPAAAKTKSCILGISQGEANASGRFEMEDVLRIDDAILGKVAPYSLRCSVRPEGTAPPRPASR